MKDTLKDQFVVLYRERADMPEWLDQSLPESVERLPVHCIGECPPREYLFFSGAAGAVAITAFWFVTDFNEWGVSFPESMVHVTDIFLLLVSLLPISIAGSFAWHAKRLVSSADSPIALVSARRLADVLEAMATAGIPVSGAVRRKVALVNECVDLRERDLRWIADALEEDLGNYYAILYDRWVRRQAIRDRHEAKAVGARLRSVDLAGSARKDTAG